MDDLVTWTIDVKIIQDGKIILLWVFKKIALKFLWAEKNIFVIFCSEFHYINRINIKIKIRLCSTLRLHFLQNKELFFFFVVLCSYCLQFSYAYCSFRTPR